MPRKKAELKGPFINVAVMAAIRHPLTYCAPQSLEVRPGQRVLVPLGKRRERGVVLEPVSRVPPGIKIREVLRVLDAEPLLSPELLRLGRWIADYYLAPVGEVFRSMLPLRPETRRARFYHLTDRGRRRLEDLESNLLEEVRASEQAGLLRFVGKRGQAPRESVKRKFPAGLLDRTLADGLLAVSEAERKRGRREVLSVRPVRSPDAPLAQSSLAKLNPRLSPVAKRILVALEESSPWQDHRELLKAAGASLSHLKKLAAANLIELSGAGPGTGPGAVESAAGLELTSPQAAVFGELANLLEGCKFHVGLLHGITASGKTEIYLRLIARTLELGRAALMLVPEIALTPSMEAQFLARFGGRVAVLHSGLSETERHDTWWRVQRGEARIVLGTRSAVFAPLKNLGVVIVDEEHDASYKQEETPRYHGRDVAVVRARHAGALAVLGSATPSLESYANAREGKYRLLKLEERVGGRSLATVEIVDMREEFRETHTQVPLSRRLREEMEAQVRARAQTMILLNRRGYSWFLLCRSCGESLRCVNCSISLTYHRREHRLICHYCGYSTGIPSRCPLCASEYLHYVGEGTEKIEQKLAELFPGARVARLDRDVTRRRGQFRRVLSDFRDGKIDILVGTQLISKGHDFPGVTLVGVVSVDTGLSLPDFRAAERTFHLLTQAAGRAGRGDAPGRVLVQTFYPEHYAIRLAAEQNYEVFFEKEMRFRRLMHYPPTAALANIIAQDEKLERAAGLAKQIADFLARLESRERGLKVLGPAPAPLARIERRYRIQFLLKSKSRARLNSLLHELANHCDARGIPPRSVVIDMDPVSLM